MICSKYPAMLSRFLDGELLPRETAELKDHLAHCTNCRALHASWRQQGIVLRGYLKRHVLGEDFVRKMHTAVSREAHGARQTEALPERRRHLFGWLPVAAAILLAAVILTQLLPHKDNMGYARVIDPGDMEVLRSSSWVRTTAGEILHAGDWLRNPVPGAAEILWRESTRLSLKAGTLAHIPDKSGQLPNQVHLVNGSISSDVQDSGLGFQVRTSAGSVSGSDGSFRVRVGDYALPQLELDNNRSEILTGTMVPVGEVIVSAGRVKIQAENASYEVLAGDRAEFSASEFAAVTAQLASADASIRIIPRSSSKGRLSTSLSATPGGLRLDFEMTNVSLKRLLECATGLEVRGGEDIAIAGNLRFSTNAKPDAVVAAVRTALQLPIALVQETRRQAIASVQQSTALTSERLPGGFKLEKDEGGSISLDFRAVPAGQAMRILRSVVYDLPEISAESEWNPITLQASALRPEDGRAFVAKALGLQIKVVDFQVGVIQIESESSGILTPAAEAREQMMQQSAGRFRGSGDVRVSASPNPEASEPLSSPTTTPSGTNAAMNSSSALSQPAGHEIAPVWSILSGGVVGKQAAATPVSNTQSGLKARVSPKVREYFGLDDMKVNPAPSTHIIWPALSADDAVGEDAAYLITNYTGLLARTLWNGYDQGGQLIAQFAIAVDKSSTQSLLAARDLPAFLGEGGHWETLSDIPLVGSRDRETRGGLVLGEPVASEQIPRQRSFPGIWLGALHGRLWLVNPSAEQATVILAVMQGGRALETEQITLAANGGRLWPDSVSRITQDHPAFFAPGTMVVVHALRGSVATGPAK